MHGRTIALAGALFTIALAGTAQADQTLDLGDPSATDAVVTSWHVVSGGTQANVRLRSEQRLGGGGTATTATAGAVTAAPSQPIAARLPIAAGGALTLVGRTGSPTIAATAEPDADGDGYGDATQDACPGDYTAQAQPCPQTETAGSPLALAPDPRGFSGSGSPMEAVQSVPAFMPRITRAGVLTRFRLRTAAGSAGDTVLQVLRPNADRSSFTVLAESAPVHAADDGVITVPASIAVQPGDTLAARSATGDLGAVAYRVGDTLDIQQPPATASNHQPFTPGTAYAARRLLVQADVETDLDGDGKGDASQDSADLRLSGAADGARHTYTIGNAGPDAALNVALAIRGGALADPPSGVTCTGAGTCRIASLAAGASVAVTTTFSGAGTVTSSATVSAFPTPDPDITNNSAALASAIPVVYANPPQTGTQQPFVVIACANVIKGTRDDDVLRGTVFGDRLVGGDGADLLKGGGGDDCLEGGSGADVLDGGDGNDRLAGDSGNDRMTGGNGNDRLTGGRGNDRLSGGNGNDIISPGAGKDTISGGPGNDTINSVDGVRETVDCGSGRDTVRADRRDRLVHCERITRKR